MSSPEQVPEFGERLGPPESEQPSCEVCFEEIDFTLTWENTRVQIYRIGVEKYDEVLMRFDHVIHKYYIEGDEGPSYALIPFDAIGQDTLDFLLENSYPRNVDPKLDAYVIEMIISDANERLPEGIGPDFENAA